MQAIEFISNLPQRLAVKLIEVYQLLLSPDHSWLRGRYPYGYCKHYPSCSEYAKQAITKYGLFKGGFLGIVRIIKCNPWTQPSVDIIH